MEDERFKGVIQWVKQYSLNQDFIRWLKENNPTLYKELVNETQK